MAGLCFCTSMLLAQDVLAGVVAAFKKGSSQELGKYMDEKVEMVIPNRTVKADRPVAASEMDRFFSVNKVNGFDVNHQGKRDESGFIVGTLATVNGIFRVNCFFRKVQNKYYIHQIRIDKKDD